MATDNKADNKADAPAADRENRANEDKVNQEQQKTARKAAENPKESPSLSGGIHGSEGQVAAQERSHEALRRSIEQEAQSRSGLLPGAIQEAPDVLGAGEVQQRVNEAEEKGYIGHNPLKD